MWKNKNYFLSFCLLKLVICEHGLLPCVIFLLTLCYLFHLMREYSIRYCLFNTLLHNNKCQKSIWIWQNLFFLLCKSVSNSNKLIKYIITLNGKKLCSRFILKKISVKMYLNSPGLVDPIRKVHCTVGVTVYQGKKMAHTITPLPPAWTTDTKQKGSMHSRLHQILTLHPNLAAEIETHSWPSNIFSTCYYPTSVSPCKLQPKFLSDRSGAWYGLLFLLPVWPCLLVVWFQRWVLITRLSGLLFPFYHLEPVRPFDFFSPHKIAVHNNFFQYYFL